MVSPRPGPPAWSNTDVSRKADIRTALRKIYSYVGEYRRGMVLAVVLSILSAVLALIGPQVLRRITDSLSESISEGYDVDMDLIAGLCMMLLVLYGLSFLFGTIEHYLLPAISEKIAYRVRKDLNRKMDRLPLGYFDRTSTGDIMSRLTNDADSIGMHFAESLSMLITAITFLAGSSIMMFYTSWKLAAVSMIPAVIAIIFMFVLVTRSQRFFRQQMRDLGKMNGHVEETYYAMDIVRAYNGRKGSEETFDGINGSLRKSSFIARVLSGMVPRMMEFLDNLSYVIVCVVGSYMIVEGEITYGVIVAFIVYVRHFTRPVGQFADSVVALQSVAASSERVFEVLDAPEMEESPDSVELAHVRGEVDFRDVRFSYVEGKEVIRGFSEHVEPGERVAIVGPTGTGKTTVVNLLMRFYDYDSGEILIDGVPVSSISRKSVRSAFAMVLQDSWILSGTLRENIAYTREDASDEDILKAIQDVGLAQFLSTLPEGLDTVIVPSALSAGQRQQLSIARAMVRDAPMLILDEATSSVDTRTERHIQDAMDTLMRGRTSFVIAHRLTTILNSDKILVMRDGTVIEHGTHDELLAKDGFYAELYRSQFEGCD
ncbi:ABC-type multidrug transport system, ATPase and permease components [Thermoplasmatales archaeon BRNA1]|nr:ABC-type multidrug transport system, ATPase and permease components [Thermoplasmatales archaeon BRNA1]